MAEFSILEIDNSKKAAVRSGKWKNPGAKLYDRLLNAVHCVGDIPCGTKEMEDRIKDGSYANWDALIKEAYLVAPVKNIKNSPHGVTPFSRSGCKYPHHVIKGNKLVISIPGLRSAYICARNEGCFDSDPNKRPDYSRTLVTHLNKHCKELGLKPVWHHGQFYLMEECEAKIEENFHRINVLLYERAGLYLFNNFSESTVDEGVFTEAVVEGPPDNRVLTSDFAKEVGEKTPEALFKWMHKNITYDKTIVGWKLKSAVELYETKTGNCHDQSYFATFILHSWGYKPGQLFFVEFKKGSSVGGNTHTMTWFMRDKKMYWFENAWEEFAGIHGPYNDINELKQAVMDAYNKDDDINSHKFDGVVFSTFSAYKLGMSLGEYVGSWRLTDDREFNKGIPNVKVEITKTRNPNDPESREAVDIAFSNMNGDAVGTASVSAVDTDHAFLYNVEVSPEYRGKGYGHSIIKYCLEHYKITELTVEPDNEVAIHLYEQYGFKRYMDWEENGRKLIDMRRNIAEEIHEEMAWIERFLHDDQFRESADEGEIKSVSDLVKKCKTPAELLKWMRCIKYAFLDKNGDVIDSDSTNKLYEDFRHQSPLQLIRSKKGVCWDCTGLARQWFERSKYPFCEVYLEIVDDEDCPSHTFIVFKDSGENQKVYWFESSWDAKKGVHPYSDLETCMDDIVSEFLKSHDANPETTKLICTSINKGMKYGCTMQEYMDFAHSSREIDLGDLFYDEVFNESYVDESEALARYFETPMDPMIDGYFVEAAVSPEDSKNAFKERWNYNNGTIEFEGTRYIIDLNTDKKTYEFNRKRFGINTKQEVKKDLAMVIPTKATAGGITAEYFISVNQDFWMYSPDNQDIIILHEIGHIVSRSNEKPYSLSVKNLLRVIRDIINRLIRRIKAFKYTIGIHGKGLDELEADAFAIQRTSPEKFQDAMRAIDEHNKANSIDDVKKALMKLYNDDDLKHRYEARKQKLMSENKPIPSFDEYKDQILTYQAKHIVAALRVIGPDAFGRLDINQRIRASKDSKFQDSIRRYHESKGNDMDIGYESVAEIVKMNGIPENHKGYTMKTLPKIMFFGSKNKHTTVKNDKVFLTPYMGIASIFIVDISKELAEEFKKETGAYPTKLSCNSSTKEWNEMEGPDLVRPLKKIHIYHNIKSLAGKTITGTSKGFIHCIDISGIRDELKLYTTKDPDREVYYDGGKSLKPIEIIAVRVKWEMTYSEEKAKAHGEGFIEAASVLGFDNDLEWMNTYMEAGEDNPGEDQQPPESDDPPSLDETEDAGKEEADPQPEEPAAEEAPAEPEDPKKEEPVKESMPKQTDRAESGKNGVRRKKLYVAFIEWCKEYNNKNTFGSIFDKDAFKVSYPFVPEEMRYFYRLANPMLCVLAGDLTFFPASDLRKVNSKNKKLEEMIIFAATPNDLRVFNIKDKKVYRATEDNSVITLQEVLGDTFDTYIQTMIQKGDILNGPIEESVEDEYPDHYEW